MSDLTCSFCGKKTKDVSLMITSDKGACICNECVERSRELVMEQKIKETIDRVLTEAKKAQEASGDPSYVILNHAYAESCRKNSEFYKALVKISQSNNIEEIHEVALEVLEIKKG